MPVAASPFLDAANCYNMMSHFPSQGGPRAAGAMPSRPYLRCRGQLLRLKAHYASTADDCQFHSISLYMAMSHLRVSKRDKHYIFDDLMILAERS